MTIDIEKFKAILESPEGRAASIKWAKEYFGRKQRNIERIVEKYYEQHTDHKLVETDVKYFDAMMEEVEVTCETCNEKLSLPRKMFDELKEE